MSLFTRRKKQAPPRPPVDIQAFAGDVIRGKLPLYFGSVEAALWPDTRDLLDQRGGRWVALEARDDQERASFFTFFCTNDLPGVGLDVVPFEQFFGHLTGAALMMLGNRLSGCVEWSTSN